MHFEWGKILNYNSCNLKPFDTQDTHARNSQKVVFEESTTSNRTKSQEKNCDYRIYYIYQNVITSSIHRHKHPDGRTDQQHPHVYVVHPDIYLYTCIYIYAEIHTNKPEKC